MSFSISENIRAVNWCPMDETFSGIAAAVLGGVFFCTGQDLFGILGSRSRWFESKSPPACNIARDTFTSGGWLLAAAGCDALSVGQNEKSRLMVPESIGDEELTGSFCDKLMASRTTLRTLSRSASSPFFRISIPKTERKIIQIHSPARTVVHFWINGFLRGLNRLVEMSHSAALKIYVVKRSTKIVHAHGSVRMATWVTFNNSRITRTSSSGSVLSSLRENLSTSRIPELVNRPTLSGESTGAILTASLLSRMASSRSTRSIPGN
ncbi:hypothetical protein BKA56DRAFT_623342 [Ilyonectria sp. MPI-CAGE-AT-0026]|nr:hypothetical protein BKA56DRAFT_623342 [Ilyonectria sp. MPI-CAGE-AT-0026]